MKQQTNLSDPEDFERKRLQYLQQMRDPVSMRRFERLGVQKGWRCLEVGAGEGSIAHWLAKQVGPHGNVVATDIDTRLLGKQHETNLEVRRHDILADELEQGHYDLIHTRAVLMHLSDPAQAVKKMAEALRPGGWLLLEEFDWISFGAVDEENPEAQAFTQKMQMMMKMLQSVHIMNMYIGRHLRSLLERLEFIDVDTEGLAGISRGGGPSTQFQLMNLQLAGPPLIGAGVLTEEDVALLRRLFADPSFYYVDGIFFGAWGR